MLVKIQELFLSVPIIFVLLFLVLSPTSLMVAEWRVRDRLARPLVLFVFLLLD